MARLGAGFTHAQARRFLRAKSFYITGVVEQAILARVQQTLFNALRGDKTMRQVLVELDTDLAEWLPEYETVRVAAPPAGGEWGSDDAGTIRDYLRLVNVPHRIETIARTNLGEALNEGRFAEFTDPDMEGWVEAFMYSAVLDNRVRDTHAAWDGVTRAVDDEVWYGPPDRRPCNGFNCRCILVPLTQLDNWVETPDEELPMDVAGPDVFPDPGFK